MAWNYPDGMSREDFWYLGEVPDRYGHYCGHGYAYNSDEYDPELDEDYCTENEEDDETEEA